MLISWPGLVFTKLFETVHTFKTSQILLQDQIKLNITVHKNNRF